MQGVLVSAVEVEPFVELQNLMSHIDFMKMGLKSKWQNNLMVCWFEGHEVKKNDCRNHCGWWRLKAKPFQHDSTAQTELVPPKWWIHVSGCHSSILSGGLQPFTSHGVYRRCRPLNTWCIPTKLLHLPWTDEHTPQMTYFIMGDLTKCH